MKKAHTIILLVLAHSLLLADNVEILGNMGISDNPETPAKEGNLTVQNNASVGGVLSTQMLQIQNGYLVIGDNASVAQYKMGFALGSGATVGGNGAIALGYNAVANGNNSLSLGAGAKTGEGSALAAGAFSKATGESAIAFGANSESSGGSSITLGSNTKAQGDNSIASGAGSISRGQGSFAAGINSETNGKVAAAFGMASRAESYGQFTVGLFNELHPNVSTDTWVATDPIFVVGNGDGLAKRSNAMVVLKNGDVIVSGIIRCTKTSKALPSGEFGSDEDNAGTAAETRTNESALNSDTGDGTPNQTDSE